MVSTKKNEAVDVTEAEIELVGVNGKDDGASKEAKAAADEGTVFIGFRPLYRLVNHWLFDTIIVAVIVLNSVLMAAEDPRENCGGTCDGMQKFISDVEIIFLIIYIGEAVIKILGLTPLGYFADNWNRLDFAIVIVSIVTLFIDQNLSMLRTIRLLRTLRALHIVPSMRRVASSLIDSMPLLKNVLIMCVFMLVVFSVFGLQMFMGTFRKQCVEPNVVNGVETYANWNADDLVFCGESGYKCPAPTVCMKLPAEIDGQATNPENGNYHYDNFGMAFLTVFLLTTAEGWTGIMYQSQDATSDLCVIYYLLVIWIGTLITISLALAALESVWGEDNEDEDDEFAIGVVEKPVEEEEKTWAQKKLAAISGALYSFEKKYSIAHTEFGRTAKVIVRTNWFETTVLLAIVANTVVLGMGRANMPASERDTLEEVNEFLLWFFVAEMVLKVSGLGVSGYIADAVNLFDAAVVVISLVEKYAGGGGLSVFRALRLLRILKLIKSWKSLRRLVKAMGNSIKAASALTMVLLLMMFIFALFGKEVFGYKLPADNRGERYHYDNFSWAFITVFVVLSGENWNALMFDAMSNVGRAWSIYFVLIIILGGYVVLNLFIAIVLDELMNTKTDEEFAVERTADIDEKEAWIMKQYQRMFKRQAGDDEDQEEAAGSKGKGLTGAEPPPVENAKPSAERRKELLRQKFDEFDTDGNGYINENEIGALLGFFNIELTMLEYHVMFADDRFTWEEFLELMNKYKIVIDENLVVTSRGKVAQKGNFTSGEKKILAEHDIDASLIVPPGMKVSEKVYIPEGSRSLYIFSHDNRFRLWMKSLAESPGLNNFVLIVIMASTICVAVDEPGASCDLKKALNAIDAFFTIIFTVEMAIKIVAMGFIFNPHSYLRSSNFNKLDFLVVVVSLATLFIGGHPCDTGGDGEQIGALKALRAFRALRPLRTVGRVENLKVVVNALMQSALPIANALALMAFFFLLFAILGVQFFAGKFNFCNAYEETANYNQAAAGTNYGVCPETDYDAGMCGANVRCTSAQCVTCITSDGTLSERRWETYHQNFDNTIQAMVVLFEMATLEAWPSIALYGVDATGTDTWPDANDYNMLAFAYFIMFILIGTFFVANLFASVACDKYEVMSQFYSGMLFLTEEQKVWVIDSKQVWSAAPKKYVTKPIVEDLEPVARSERFDGFIMGCIILNIIVMSAEYEDMSQEYEEVMLSLNWAFVAIFTLEAIVKILGLGPECYLSDAFNVFDVIIVLASLISQAVQLGPIASVFRIFRVTRVLKLIPKAQRLMAVVKTVYHSIPALFNVALLTGLFFLIFACLGMSLFGEVVYGAQLSRHANFETFPMAMLTLFRVATGEDWNGMMYDCAIAKGEYGMEGQQCSTEVPCPAEYEGQPCGCGMPIVSQVYFITFNVLAAFVMLNVVVAAILTHYDLAQKSAEGLSDQLINAFKEAWWYLDPTATARIQAHEFETFFMLIAPIFGFESTTEAANALAIKCEDTGGEYRFSDVLYVVAFQKFGISLTDSLKGKELEKKIQTQKVKLDNEPGVLEKPVIPQITEAQLASMSPEELRQELVKRGHVRFKNRSVPAE